MKHFFYAVYILFYTGAVFMGGMFVGQFLQRSRKVAQRKKSMLAAAPVSGDVGSPIFSGRKVAMMRKRD